MTLFNKCYRFLKYFVIPSIYARFILFYWSGVCSTVRMMSIGLLIVLFCGIENSLLVFKIILNERSNLEFPVTII